MTETADDGTFSALDSGKTGISGNAGKENEEEQKKSEKRKG